MGHRTDLTKLACRAPVHVVVGRRSRSLFYLDAVEPLPIVTLKQPCLPSLPMACPSAAMPPRNPSPQPGFAARRAVHCAADQGAPLASITPASRSALPRRGARRPPLSARCGASWGAWRQQRLAGQG